ncbi:MAG: putative DNA-binding domain-containing protein [Pseudomonadota bacterium]|nr:putative DNA-binding domain-containing protein [Pseudomonadota bacterium]
MPSLHELQRAFSEAAVFGDPAAVASLGIVAGGLKPAARIDIYRANVLGNFRRALAATYPVVKRLVGAPFFDAAADHFVRGHPSIRGDINRYGADFAGFLDAYPPARELAYLPDVARLEWAIDQANIARDAPPLDLTALSAVLPELHGELRFLLHPSAHLIVSRFPILHIWQVNQPERGADERIGLDEGGDALLVERRPAALGGISIQQLSDAEHVFLALLAAGRPLDEAANRSAALSPEFDLAAALQRHVAGQTIVAFRAPVISPRESRP